VIPLVAPTTTADRLARICASAAGFVYCVGVTGVTGARRTVADDAIALLDAVRQLTALPRALGFGLATHEHLDALRGHAEAAVVGSALLDRIGEAPANPVAGATAFLTAMIGRQAARGE
jgi:tryptophan synthase alpha chain